VRVVAEDRVRARVDRRVRVGVLVALGKFLGSESFKPPGKGRTDAAWLWPTLRVTVEAKSGQRLEEMLSMDYVRQANTQLALLASDREEAEPPEGSISVIVSPRGVVDPDAVPIAAPHVYRAEPKLVLDIARDTMRAWKVLRGAGAGVSGDVLHIDAARIMCEHRVLPTQVQDRLRRDPIYRPIAMQDWSAS
jgi:hypothetical protein